jgi:hypothetical protein
MSQLTEDRGWDPGEVLVLIRIRLYSRCKISIWPIRTR